MCILESHLVQLILLQVSMVKFAIKKTVSDL
jgi:hypothetical protein